MRCNPCNPNHVVARIQFHHSKIIHIYIKTQSKPFSTSCKSSDQEEEEEEEDGFHFRFHLHIFTLIHSSSKTFNHHSHFPNSRIAINEQNRKSEVFSGRQGAGGCHIGGCCCTVVEDGCTVVDGGSGGGNHVESGSHGVSGRQNEYRRDWATLWSKQQPSWVDPFWCFRFDLDALLCVHRWP